MELAVIEYIRENYAEEKQTSLVKALEIIDTYQVDNPDQELLDLIYGFHDRHNEDTCDGVYDVIEGRVRLFLESHQITLSPDASLENMLQIASCLDLLQDLEDYMPVALAMESFEPNNHQFFLICHDLCQITDVDYYETISEVSDAFISQLKGFVQEKLDLVENEEPDHQKARNNLRRFVRLDKRDWFGVQLVKHGIAIGLSMDTYLNYAREYLQEAQQAGQVEVLAGHIFSLLLIAQESYEDPRKYFASESDVFGLTLDEVTKISSFITKWNAEMQKVGEK